MTDTPPASVRVALPEGGYFALTGRGLCPRLGDLVRHSGIKVARVHVFEDSGVPRTLRDAAVASFEIRKITRSEFRLNESSKSLATLEQMLVDLAEAGLERTDLVVALGGGILGDVAGLAAGLHRRGVRVVQCPTTLLSMVDASVGGKTAVNLQAGIEGLSVLLKNAVGVFHQPSLVVADVDALASLDSREVRCGLAECIKHAAIAGSAGDGLLSLRNLTESMPRLLARETDLLTSLVTQSVELKAGIVASDERETATGTTPGRRALNLGHTFAHAIEGCETTRVEVDGSRLHPKHGEAVGLGLIAAARLAEVLGVCPKSVRTAIEACVRAAGLPTKLSEAPSDATLIAAMKQDKKAGAGRLHLVLPTADGVMMRDDLGESDLASAWQWVF